MVKMSTKTSWCNWLCCRGSYISDSTSVCMVTLCLIQGLLWSSFSVFLLAIQTCALQFDFPGNINIRNTSNNFTYVVNLIHAAYLSGSCSKQKVDVLTTDSTSDRTYNLLLIHGFLNAVWIPISVLLIVGILCRLRGCCVLLAIYAPWLLVTFAVVAFDLFAGSLYVKDFEHASTLRSFLLYIRFKTSTDEIIPQCFQKDAYTFYAPLSVILYFTRCVLITLFNVVTFLHVLRLMINLCREQKFEPPSGLFLGGYDEIYSPIIRNEVENIPLQSRDKAVCNYYTTDLEMRATQLKPGMKHFNKNRDNTFHDYLTLIQTPVYQHVYEDIWRDVKKEKLVYANKSDRLYYNENTTPIEPVSPVYDYLGRPVLEYKIATVPPCNIIEEEEEENSPDVCRHVKAKDKEEGTTCHRTINKCVPPALPPCNTEEQSKKMLLAQRAALTLQLEQQPPAPPVQRLKPSPSPFSEYESISSYYEKMNELYEKTDQCDSSTNGDDVSELYSCVKKVSPLVKKKSSISFEESDSAYNSGSSVNYYGSMQSSNDGTKEFSGSEYNYIRPNEDSEKCNKNSYTYIDSNGNTKNPNNIEYNYINPSDSICKDNVLNKTDNDRIGNNSHCSTSNSSYSSETNYNSNCTNNLNTTESFNSAKNESGKNYNISGNRCNHYGSSESNKNECRDDNERSRYNNGENKEYNAPENSSSSERCNRPEPPDISKMTISQQEKRKIKGRHLPPLTIKPLPPNIKINPSEQDEELRVRM